MTQRSPRPPKGNKSKRRREAAAARSGARPADRTSDAAYQKDWAESRSGAHASRGFQFQHAVGALLAAQIASGTLDGVLIPEALDDMTIEATENTNVQIKARGPEQGPFPAGVAARHITDAWLTSERRADPPARQWVVLEGSVDGTEGLGDLGPTLREVLRPGSSLAAALERRVPQHLSQAELERLLDRTSVHCTTWTDLEVRTDGQLGELPHPVDVAGRHLIARSLLIDIASATADNATRDARNRVELDLSSIRGRVASVQELIDVQGLNAALRSGVCSFIDWRAGAEAGDRFYEGESTQPGHIASGLVIERPELLAQVIAGINDNKPVLITGPSGIGKSAVMWTVPRTMRGVTWFRVNRLTTDTDANLLLRLARAYKASVERPVGFLVDAAGTAHVNAWDALRSRAISSDGVLLVGTARREDLPQLGSLAGTATVEVRLDEPSAKAIFEGLQRRGATAAPHWREPYEQANGLTLEFTYLLTRGRRLHDVIGDQISKRIEEQRDDELNLLAVVALAHQWGGTLRVERAAQVLGAQEGSLRRPISRLVHEHLLVESNGELAGLHPVRSTAITDALHAVAPPTLQATFVAVLDAMEDRQLPSFIVTALRHHPALAPAVVDTAERDASTARRLASYLQGLRLSDSEIGIREWIEIIEEEGVKRSTHLTVVMLGLSGTDMGDLTPPTIRAALERMSRAPIGDHRDQLAARIGPERISALLFGASAEHATMLLATLHGWGQELPLPHEPLSTALVDELMAAGLKDLSETMSTFHDYDLEFGQQVLAILGGESRMLDLIREQEPWLLEAVVRASPDGPVGYARILHVDDEIQGSGRDRCVALARTFNRLVPSIVKPDIEARWPGDREIRIGQYAESSSGLLRRYDHNQTTVAWNTARHAIAHALLGVPDALRLGLAAPLIRDLVPWYREVCTRWIRGEPPAARDVALQLDAIRLNDAGYALPPSLGSADVAFGEVNSPTSTSMTDPLSLAITTTTDLFVRLREAANPTALTMYVSDHLVTHTRECLSEPWHLIPNGEEPIASLNQLLETSNDLVEVLYALAADSQYAGVMRRAAARGPSRLALSHAADMARQLRRSSLEIRRDQIRSAISATAPEWGVDIRSDEVDGYLRFAVMLEVPSLMDWLERQEHVQNVVQVLSEDQAMVQFLVLPTRHSKRFDQIGFHFIRNPLPAVSIDGWEHLVPAVHDHCLAELIRDGVRALQVLSAVAELPDEGRTHPEVVAAVELMNQLLSDSVESLTSQHDDLANEAANELVRFAERVQAELEGTWRGATFAAAVAGGFAGEQSDEFMLVSLLGVCSLAWPVDPESVRGLLGW